MNFGQHLQTLKNAASMRTCLTKFSRIVECGAVQKCVNLVDLVKSFQEYLLAKFGVDTAENGPLSKISQKLEQKLQKA